MRIRSMIVLLAAVGAIHLGGARPVKSAEPTLEVRLQSVNVLLDKAEYVAGLAGKEDIVQGVKLILKNLQVDGKGIEGVDPKRPFGLYATLTTEVINSPVTAMVPIANTDRFLTMLKERLDITPEKVEGGRSRSNCQTLSRTQWREQSICASRTITSTWRRSPKDLDPRGLIAPKAFFANGEGAVASFLVRGDGIPAEVKTFVIGQFELAAAEQRKKNGKMEEPTEKAFLDWFADGLSGGLKSLLNDAKELRVRIDIDAKTDELSAELVLTPKSGTNLAKYTSSLAGRPSLPSGIVAAANPLARASIKIAMTPDLKKGFGKMLDEVFEEALKKKDGPEKEAMERALKVLAPTLKEAELDMAATLIGPDAKGRHTFLGALAVKDGKEIEKLAREFSAFAGGAADFTFDVEKIGDFNLHKVVLNDVPDEVEKIFGTKTIWVAVSDTHVAISMEPDGVAIRAGLKAKPITVNVLSAEVSLAKLLPLVAKDLKPDEVKALLNDAFGAGGSTGKDTLIVSITGGKVLTAKAKVKGKGVRLMFGANLLKAK